RELRQHDGHQGQLPCDAEHRGYSIMPSLVHMLDTPRTGEVAGRSPCPCVPQVDADVMVWLRSPHDSLRDAIHIRPHSDTPAYVLGAPSAFRLLSRVGEGDISALGCGLTGSCSSTFHCYSLGNHLGVTASPQFPLPARYVSLPVDDGSPPLGLMALPAGGTAFFKSPFLGAFQSYAPRTIRDEAHYMSGPSP